MGVQLLSTVLDIRSETISLLKKLWRWLNWQEEARTPPLFFVKYDEKKLSAEA